jgi:hypothetical protein
MMIGLSNERLQEIFMTDMGSDGISGGGILAPTIRPSQNVILSENARRERQSAFSCETYGNFNRLATMARIKSGALEHSPRAMDPISIFPWPQFLSLKGRMNSQFLMRLAVRKSSVVI